MHPSAQADYVMRVGLSACAAIFTLVAVSAQPPAWTTWSATQATTVGTSTIARGRIAGGRRILNTERARSYKLMATWMTPEVVQASARLLQLRSRLTDGQTLEVLNEAQGAGDTVIVIDLDPDEGSGVIPLEWEAFLQPGHGPDRAVPGQKAPALRDVKALAGVAPRNYDYDRFWMIFPLTAADGQPLFRDTDAEAELAVRIYDREGRVTWPIPPSIRARGRAPSER
ncbi:MAG: hypothetical protein ACRD26_20240 [Vicinamibacterales bacterium]